MYKQIDGSLIACIVWVLIGSWLGGLPGAFLAFALFLIANMIFTVRNNKLSSSPDIGRHRSTTPQNKPSVNTLALLILFAFMFTGLIFQGPLGLLGGAVAFFVLRAMARH